NGNPDVFKFPHTSMPGLHFSFSGIKTAFLYFLRDQTKKDPDFVKNNLNDICASMQRHLVKMLLDKLVKASEITGINRIAIAGGVSANTDLREQLKEVAVKKGWEIFIPDFQYCTDNAAMIAIAGYYKYQAGQFANQDVEPLPRMKFE
ncbi:MAG: tRNA (adenosine(37)-N6)-threonylcarbamoyltransferase complex transferase subunit TsaD, partial [Bacteroidota bacterium]|nr:tRNA (adenosine(37)-N6)-threonylcarbamoyltransferase complex transferase subunit TsaD [Bacteroidota bacterium]